MARGDRVTLYCHSHGVANLWGLGAAPHPVDGAIAARAQDDWTATSLTDAPMRSMRTYLDRAARTWAPVAHFQECQEELWAGHPDWTPARVLGEAAWYCARAGSAPHPTRAACTSPSAPPPVRSWRWAARCTPDPSAATATDWNTLTSGLDSLSSISTTVDGVD
jgi:hypothetical protein